MGVLGLLRASLRFEGGQGLQESCSVKDVTAGSFGVTWSLVGQMFDVSMVGFGDVVLDFGHLELGLAPLSWICGLVQ